MAKKDLPRIQSIINPDRLRTAWARRSRGHNFYWVNSLMDFAPSYGHFDHSIFPTILYNTS